MLSIELLVFSPFIEDIVFWVGRVGHVMLFIVGALVLAYAAMYAVSSSPMGV